MPGDISLNLKARLALEKAGFRFTHSLGQNFIFDEELLGDIADAAGAGEGVNALEIGPGAGMLTAILAQKGCNVISLEIDKTLEGVLREVLDGFNNVRVLYLDALKADISALAKERFGEEDYIICANLPYYITADFILKAVALKPRPKRITLMLQREAAQRVLSRPGEEGWCALSAITMLFCEGEKLMDVQRSLFTPVPHVDSALISLTPRERLVVNDGDESAFVGFIKSAFAMRRKTLSNNLSSSLRISKQSVEDALSDLGLNPKARGEALTLDELSGVFYALKGDL